MVEQKEQKEDLYNINNGNPLTTNQKIFFIEHALEDMIVKCNNEIRYLKAVKQSCEQDKEPVPAYITDVLSSTERLIEIYTKVHEQFKKDYELLNKPNQVNIDLEFKSIVNNLGTIQLGKWKDGIEVKEAYQLSMHNCDPRELDITEVTLTIEGNYKFPLIKKLRDANLNMKVPRVKIIIDYDP